MSLKQKIADDMKAAMRAGDKQRRDTLRLLQAGLKQREVDERVEVDDAVVIAVLEKMLKQRLESIKHYVAADRNDLVVIEEAEITVLQHYMPQPLSETELEVIVKDAIAAIEDISPGRMGKVMALLKPKLAGRADMSKVSALVKSLIVD
ncbi:MAG: GatB/YqeY domain-containing protein [Nitrosomonas sp.]|nr:GatB/YqeY domain-containing protein [Nitrosomonas sp.]MCC7136088.1 GatB/YqeY domain-containing protein [Nitrosomonas sp.]